MKYRKVLNKAFVLLVASLACIHYASAQESKKDKNQEKTEAIRNLVQSKNFVFVAQTAYPMGGRNINLTSVYDLKLSGDTLISDLPYYGRAFVAPMDPTEGGIHFTSTQFTYTVNEKKKGRWDVSIIPKDARDVREMQLSISSSGYGTLQVTSNNRQLISFSGYIVSKDKFR